MFPTIATTYRKGVSYLGTIRHAGKANQCELDVKFFKEIPYAAVTQYITAFPITVLIVLLFCGSASFLGLSFSHLALICMFRWVEHIYREFQKYGSFQYCGYSDI